MSEREIRAMIQQAIANIIENIDCSSRIEDAISDKVSEYEDVIEDAYMEQVESNLVRIIEDEIDRYDFESEVDF